MCEQYKLKGEYPLFFSRELKGGWESAIRSKEIPRGFGFPSPLLIGELK
jgi:hypothetical protein